MRKKIPLFRLPDLIQYQITEAEHHPLTRIEEIRIGHGLLHIPQPFNTFLRVGLVLADPEESFFQDGFL